jgi:hypothetical protein
MELNQILFHLQDFLSISTAVRQFHKTWNISDDNFYMLIERIGQVLQVAIVTNSLRIDQGNKTKLFLSIFIIIL